MGCKKIKIQLNQLIYVRILRHFLSQTMENSESYQEVLLYSWNFFPNSASSHWLLRGQMTSNNETVSLQNL